VVPSTLCPQPCPAPPGTSGLRSLLPASWLRLPKASYSAVMPITGLPLPYVAMKAYSMPATPLLIENPSFSSTS
jgi:hypothetical protein